MATYRSTLGYTSCHMRRLLLVAALCFGVCGSLAAQAGIEIGTVSSGASFEPGVHAPWGIASIFVSGITVSGIVQASSLPLPFELEGVRVTVAGIPAPLFAVAELTQYQNGQQINIQMPDYSGAVINSGGELWVEVVVEQNGQRAAKMQRLRRDRTGEFFFSPNYHGLFQHGSDYSPVTRENPARAGEVVIGYLTGLGGTTPDVQLGSPAPFDPPAVANRSGTTYAPHPRYRWLSVADRHVTPEFVGLTPGFVGLYQVNFTIPADLAPGDHIIRMESGECTGISPIGFGSCVGGEVPRATAASNPVLIAVGQ